LKNGVSRASHFWPQVPGFERVRKLPEALRRRASGEGIATLLKIDVLATAALTAAALGCRD
jgi:hypothetical protein